MIQSHVSDLPEDRKVLLLTCCFLRICPEQGDGMKGCTDYTEEARNWIRPQRKRGKVKSAALILLVVVIAVVATTALWPRQSEEGFNVANAKEQEKTVETAPAQPEAVKEVTAPAKESVENRTLIIYITGAVEEPGVYELQIDDRLNDAIILAGGLAEGSATNYINLAAPLQDGTHIHIPYLSEIESGEAAQIAANGATGTTLPQNSADAGNEQQDRLVNINTAGQSELETLPGIGSVTAQRIVDYREKNGPFKSIEELKNISGIGEKKFEDLADKVCV